MAAVPSFYRRVLPSPAIEFASDQGKELFAEALGNGKLGGFYKLISYYQTQSEPAYCGLATLSMVLNALEIDPGRKWKGPWRWFDDTMLDCCEPLEKVKVNGISFDKVACLALCNGANVETYRANKSTVDDFRKYVVACTSSENCHVIVSYHRKCLNQTGSGHFSPIGGYHAVKDMVLILDVARFKYPPHWVPLTVLWEAMNTVDEATGLHRGFMLVSKLERAPSVLFTLSCRHNCWDITAKYLTDEVPRLVSSNEIKDIQGIMSAIFASSTTNLREIINWVAEVRELEEGKKVFSEEEKGRLLIKEEVLKQVRDTKLYEHINKWISSCNNCASSAGSQCSLGQIGYDLCCQGAQLLCGKVGISNGKCSRVTHSRTTEPEGGHSVTVVSGKVIVENAEHGIEVLVPCSRGKADGQCGCDPTTYNGKHPSVHDILTILILALPLNTWSGIEDERLRVEFLSVVSSDNLPDILRQEVLHLRKQLQYVITDLCSCLS